MPEIAAMWALKSDESHFTWNVLTHKHDRRKNSHTLAHIKSVKEMLCLIFARMQCIVSNDMITLFLLRWQRYSFKCNGKSHVELIFGMSEKFISYTTHALIHLIFCVLFTLIPECKSNLNLTFSIRWLHGL